MCSTCHYCGAKLSDSEDITKEKNGNSVKLHGGGTISCKICSGKRERDTIKSDGFSHFLTPMVISPSISLSNSDRTFSSCSDLSVDASTCYREGATESSQEDVSYRLDGLLQNSSFGVHKISAESESRFKDGNYGDGVRNVEIMHTSSGDEVSRFTDDSNSAEVWELPEPEDPNEDLERSVAYADDDDDEDDDECGDGTKWGQPSNLSHFKDDGCENYKSKQAEKQRAFQGVINGRFKDIVNHLLKSVGVSSFEKTGEGWLDIVSSLSWEAASFLKPEAIDGKATDPNVYVKVKCIATGSRSQSQVIEGLVFKKHAAHKHMPNKYKNPRLLLMKGFLGQSSELSSFDSIKQEKEQVESVIEMIEMCHPNVLLVEKSVSRDVQESILAKGMTLVLDMKLHRLERIARYTSSPILSPDTLMNQKLKQCRSFCIEKFVEELNGCSEGGKRQCKTLMFLEGCPTRLGCTILLKGSHSDELKRIKCVVQGSILIAYHLILETSFLVDRNIMFSTISSEEIFPSGQQFPLSETTSLQDSCPRKSPAEVGAKDGLQTVDVPIVNGNHEENLHDPDQLKEGVSTFFVEPYNPAVFSGLSSLSASLKKVIGDIPLPSTVRYQSLSAYLGFDGGKHNDQDSEVILGSKTLEVSDQCDMEGEGSCDEEKSLAEGKEQSLSICSDDPMMVNDSCDNAEIQCKQERNNAMDSQSILVLMSKKNALRGTTCEQSHFSHIMFYRNFDVPLGKFLSENLLNQKTQCTTCGELPEAHFYYYAHHDRQLTIQIKHLTNGKGLPGDAEGKLWMWSRCGKCKIASGVSKSTKRVLVSTAARGLSFGKFLELSFTKHPSFARSASCGHSLDKDFLYFFGLGHMIAMFRYSPVITYTVSLPHQVLQFSNSIRDDWLKKEFENVYMKCMLLFSEVSTALKQIKSQSIFSTHKLQGLGKDFSDIEEMLKTECSELEANIHNVFSKNGNTGQGDYRLLRLNCLLWDLLLEAGIWEKRLRFLLTPDPVLVNTCGAEESLKEKIELKKCDTVGKGSLTADIGFPSVEANECSVKEIPVGGTVQGTDDQCNHSSSTENTEKSHVVANSSSMPDSNTSPDVFIHHVENCQGGNNLSGHLLQMDRTNAISTDTRNYDSYLSMKVASLHSVSPDFQNSPELFWLPFSEIRQIYIKELQRGHFPKFESDGRLTEEHFSTLHQLISEEGSRLHISLRTDNYIVSDYEGELSSIIACALALLNDTEFSNEDSRREVARTNDSLRNLIRFPTMPSPHWSLSGGSFNGRSESDSVHSAPSISSEECHFSSFDGMNLLESLHSLEVSLGVTKAFGKGKYTVTCLYANEFRDLRNRCCPSEIDFIASLSRCKTWDAKGGKSKSVFAKTLDDRFIIKEIKKTEFDSFDEFAPHYFKYMTQSFELGNQTCLAKVLGIYQVTVRQGKSGKEVRHDLMVMESLAYCRNITRQYDLKGALHARYSSVADGSEDVLLDQNFVNDMNSSPLYVSSKAKCILQRAVWNDTVFLNSINVMDYSLLVGVDAQKRELVCGIIDYLRQYTWDKQLETWVKSSLVVPKNVLPTVISPKEYKKRFRKFMSTHFLWVPDDWCSEESADPCELCGTKSNDPSHSI